MVGAASAYRAAPVDRDPKHLARALGRSAGWSRTPLPQRKDRRARAIHVATAALLTLAGAGILEGLSLIGLAIPNPSAFLFIIIAISALLGGVVPGVVSAVITTLYIALAFSYPGEPFQLPPEEVRRTLVEDNGIGIAPEHLDRIWDPFERLHGSESYAGSGIGLAIVRRGIGRLGGRTGVQSTLGVGSRFWFELPLAEGRE